MQVRATRTAPIAPQQIGRDTAFVDEDVLIGVVCGLPLAPAPSLRRDINQGRGLSSLPVEFDDAQLFGQSRTLRIKQLLGLDGSTGSLRSRRSRALF